MHVHCMSIGRQHRSHSVTDINSRTIEGDNEFDTLLDEYLRDGLGRGDIVDRAVVSADRSGKKR